MKIGILTLHSAHNYGAVMQAFATRKAFSNISEDNEVNIIDYRQPDMESRKGFKLDKNIRYDLIQLERLLLNGKVKSRRAAFESFIKNNHCLSRTCSSKKELSEVASGYDVLVSGSDQLWNRFITDGDLAYYLDIDKTQGCKKISYASSFGEYRFPKDSEDKMREIFNDFAHISCRELDGCEYIEQITRLNCTNCCDPTVLLDKSEYAQVYSRKGAVRDKIKKLAKEKYLIVYNLTNEKEVYDAIEKIAKAKNLKVYQLIESVRKKSVVDKIIQDASPEEFLYLMDNSEYVITNSFHGTCFSVIFQKDFYVITPHRPNRMMSLLSIIGIPERIILKPENMESINPDSSIDYGEVKIRLEEYTKKSKDYIKKAIYE